MKDTQSPARAIDTENEAACYLKMSPRTLQAWRQRGEGPRYFKVGRSVRYDRAELDRWLAERTRANTAGGAA